MVDLPAIASTQNTALALDPAEVETAKRYIIEQHAPATRRAYKADMRTFATWCNERAISPMPAAPETVATFLADQAANGVRPATLTRRVAAIRYAHNLAGLDTPTKSELVTAAMKGIRRAEGAAVERKAPATADIIAAMVAHMDEGKTGLRDRALILLGFAGAFRRSELVALQVEDLVATNDGWRVHIRQSKTDQAGEGQEIAILRGSRFAVMEIVQAWLESAEITEGPIFRAITKGGNVSQAALTPKSVGVIVKAAAARAGFDPAAFGAHSLRSGFLTSAAEHGASVFKMMETSRHRSVETLRGYVRSADLFKDHAGARFL